MFAVACISRLEVAIIESAEKGREKSNPTRPSILPVAGTQYCVKSPSAIRKVTGLDVCLVLPYVHTALAGTRFPRWPRFARSARPAPGASRACVEASRQFRVVAKRECTGWRA